MPFLKKKNLGAIVSILQTHYTTVQWFKHLKAETVNK